jgi:hypothetical protein
MLQAVASVTNFLITQNKLEATSTLKGIELIKGFYYSVRECMAR